MTIMKRENNIKTKHFQLFRFPGKLIFIWLLYATGCNTTGKQDQPTDENRQLKEKLTVIKVPDETGDLTGYISDDPEFIKIEPGPDHVVADISELRIHKNRYYILDRITTAVSCFDENGKFLHSFSREGSGPGEFVSLSALNLNSYNETLEIYDRSGQHIQVFNLSGQHLSTLPAATYFNSFASTGKDTYVLQVSSDNPDSYNFLLENNGKITNRFIPSKGMDNLIFNFRITDNQNHIFLTHGSSNFVYTLQDNEIVPRYYVDFGSRNLPEEILRKQEIGPKEFFKIFVKDYSLVIFSFYEDENHITFVYMVRKKPYWAIYDKKSGHTATGSILLFGELEILPFYKKDEWYYSILYPLLAKEQTDGKEPRSPAEKAIKKMILETDPNSQNPVLVRFRLKEIQSNM